MDCTPNYSANCPRALPLLPTQPLLSAPFRGQSSGVEAVGVQSSRADGGWTTDDGTVRGLAWGVVLGLAAWLLLGLVAAVVVLVCSA